MTVTSDEIEFFTYPLKHYLVQDYVEFTDFKQVIEERELVSEGVYVYHCPYMDIWLDEEGYVVENERQKVIDEKYYYRFTDDPSVEEDMAFEYVSPYEWHNTSLPWVPDEEAEEETVGGG